MMTDSIGYLPSLESTHQPRFRPCMTTTIAGGITPLRMALSMRATYPLVIGRLESTLIPWVK